jgi:hypothetical protein
MKNDRRLIILSAHDTTITMILSALSLAQNEAPPFASTLIFELWKIDGKFLVKLLYNDKILSLSDYCYGYSASKYENFCDLNTFYNKILVGTHDDMRSECGSLSNDPEFFIFGLFDEQLSLKKISLATIVAIIVLFVIVIALIVWCYRRI